MMYRVLFFFVVVVVVFVTFDFEDFKVPSITVNSPFDGSISGEGGGDGGHGDGLIFGRKNTSICNLLNLCIIFFQIL